MKSLRRVIRRHTVLALLAVLAVGIGWLVPARAQQQAPPSWKQGQSPEMATSPLSPHAQPPAPLPAERIPVDKIKVPPGFKGELWASGSATPAR